MPSLTPEAVSHWSWRPCTSTLNLQAMHCLRFGTSSHPTLPMLREDHESPLLPHELKDQIKDLVYEMGLRPGLLYHPATAIYEAGPKSQPAPNIRLLTVDKRVHSKYAERFWSQSILIVDALKPSFLNALTKNAMALKSIRRVHLKRSTKDLDYGPEEQTDYPGTSPVDIAPHTQSYFALRTAWLVKAFYVHKLALSLKD
ncbi:MAG: hypothetical protein Q9184_005646 [Pyrenodesmia sp. 2 TL-2023]